MKQTSIAKGFDFFTGTNQLLPLIDCFIIYFCSGIYMWDIDRIVTISWRKQLHEVPWADPIMIENDEVPWVVQYHYGSFRHFPEPLHATQDITKESMKMLVQCSCMFPSLLHTLRSNRCHTTQNAVIIFLIL